MACSNKRILKRGWGLFPTQSSCAKSFPDPLSSTNSLSLFLEIFLSANCLPVGRPSSYIGIRASTFIKKAFLGALALIEPWREKVIKNRKERLLRNLFPMFLFQQRSMANTRSSSFSRKNRGFKHGRKSTTTQ